MSTSEPAPYPVCLHCPIRLAIASFTNAIDLEATDLEATDLEVTDLEATEEEPTQ